MNTIISKEQFLQFRAAFKNLARLKALLPEDIILYNIIRGKSPDHGFTPIGEQNYSKIASNGNDRMYAYNQAKVRLLARFEQVVPNPTWAATRPDYAVRVRIDNESRKKAFEGRFGVTFDNREEDENGLPPEHAYGVILQRIRRYISDPKAFGFNLDKE